MIERIPIDELKVDQARLGRHTGIFIRATNYGKPGTYDLAELDKASLWKWLRSRGGDNLWAENVVAMLLDHGAFAIHLTEDDFK